MESHQRQKGASKRRFDPTFIKHFARIKGNSSRLKSFCAPFFHLVVGHQPPPYIAAQASWGQK
jgi:hypothetical protein